MCSPPKPDLILFENVRQRKTSTHFLCPLVWTESRQLGNTSNHNAVCSNKHMWFETQQGKITSLSFKTVMWTHPLFSPFLPGVTFLFGLEWWDGRWWQKWLYKRVICFQLKNEINNPFFSGGERFATIKMVGISSLNSMPNGGYFISILQHFTYYQERNLRVGAISSSDTV